MAAEHVMFKFEDLKVNSHDEKQTDRMTTKLLSSRPCIKCGETNNHDNIIGGGGGEFQRISPLPLQSIAIMTT